ncbi:response regulator transcription factor [Flavilitoribacter nigricans]|uniref:Response regulatory domain-containing protein n=1 Tax=Flavilitoribacter nigricans (strain ATCC 23147 / DSM 23189 / NBRC 102662 / NCIMB 1420 / SS-2) TaxID=1122177 RepID=A0A2D0N1A4_FLAN2|nr:response regulator transcription factor [Flavilitoribacter nigricans]PHN02146.1 hypothetical protein CRP01_33700 [Flavilitoribacter nigricans DSM 23189 = NBRC 102662]
MAKVVVFEKNRAGFVLMRVACEPFLEEIELIHILHENALFRYIEQTDIRDIALFIIALRSPVCYSREVIRKLRSTKELIPIPIIIFSPTAYLRDAIVCKDLGANGYLLRSQNLEKFQKTVRFMILTWVDIDLDSNRYQSLTSSDS